MTRLRTVLLFLVAALLAPALSARAQTRDLAGRLPGDTLFYVYSRGAASVPAGTSNALVSLWNDPGFAPARQLILEGITDDLSSNPRFAKVPAGEWEELLRDPFLLGARLKPPSEHAAAEAHEGKDKAASPKSSLSVFLVVAAHGKAAEDARDALLGARPGASVRLTSSGYLLAAGDHKTMEMLLAHYGAAAPAASDTIAALPSYQEARRELAELPSLEWFLRVPDVSTLHLKKTPGFDTGAFFRALHLERIHLLCGGIDLAAPTAGLRAAVLGDTSPGSLFDLFGANTGSFPTLAAAPPASSINISRLDLGAVVSTVVNAMTAATGPQGAPRVQMIAGLVSASVLPALGGEYTSIWPHSVTTAGIPPLFVMTIHQEAATRLFQSTLAPFVQPAGQEGSIRYFRTVPHKPGTKAAGKAGAAGKSDDAAGKAPAAKPKAPAASRETSFIALTPQFLLAGRDEQLVKQRARALTAATPPPGLADSPRFRAARAGLPAELSGLAFFDLQHINWTKSIEQAAARMRKSDKSPHAAERADALEKWAKAGGGAVLARHLHEIIGASQKDAHGIHWTGNIH
jgi:hypothetical protein